MLRVCFCIECSSNSEMEDKMNKKINYVLEDFYLRVPYYNFEKYSISSMLDKDITNFLRIDFQENLLVNSRDYYENMINTDKTSKTNMKYLIRSIYRTTPFGLNSGVLKGRFCKENELSDYCINDCFKKWLRPDYEWMSNVIKLAEKKIGDQLCVTKGDTFKKNNYIFKIWSSCFSRCDNKLPDAILNTKVIDYIDNVIEKEKYVRINNLIFLIQKKLQSDVDYAYIFKFVQTLLENEYLISDLRIPLICSDQLDLFLKKLETYTQRKNSLLFNDLRCIQDKINFYNTNIVGKDQKVLKDIICKMDKIYKVKNPIHVDMYSPSNIKLDRSLKNDIEDFINFCSKWASHNTYNSYITKFKDEYGNQAVKFLDVINKDKGLGYPNKDSKNNLILKDDIKSAFISALLENKEQDVLNISAMDTQIYSKDVHPLQGEVAFNIIKENNVFKYIVTPLGGSYDINKSRGRFNHILSTDDLDIPSSNFDDVEITFFPKNSHHGNVMTCTSPYKYYLSLGSNIEIANKKRIDISDLYLEVIIDRIYILNKKNNRYLRFHVSNMFNMDAFPLELKILLEISHGQNYSILTLQKSINHIILNVKADSPRVIYKNFILYPRTWFLPKNIISAVNEHKYHEFKNSITNLCIKNNIPDLVVVGSMDQKLLLNMKLDMHLRILYDLIKNNNDIRIEENLFTNENLILSSKEGKHYISEFVFNVSSNNVCIDNKSSHCYVDFDKICNNKYYFGNQWISLKIYMSEESMNSFIVKELFYLIQQINSKVDDAKFYYLRYRDNKSHIRLRIKSNNYLSLINLIIHFLNILKDQDKVDDFIIDSYSPEVNRYGGEKCILLAEEYFYFDSISSIDILQNKLNKNIAYDLNTLFLFVALKTYLMFTDDYSDIYKFLDSYKQPNLNKKTYNKYKECLDELFSVQTENLNIDSFDLNKMFDNRIVITKEYFSIISDMSLFRKREIINSLIHMTFNRLIGINRKRENEMMGILSRYIYGISAREKYDKK